jgi:hypothetical protein
MPAESVHEVKEGVFSNFFIKANLPIGIIR